MNGWFVKIFLSILLTGIVKKGEAQLSVSSSSLTPRFRILAIYEQGGHHLPYSLAARGWLDQLAVDSNIHIDFIHQTDSINVSFLSRYQLFIQLDYPPYGWTDTAANALRDYIENGRGGWLGFHHASLLGEFDGYPVWNWFADWMGGIRWKDYISGFASANVKVEAPAHPVMAGLPPSFVIEREEWYTYDKSPRGQVKILATVDESSYRPDSPVKMGDHPVIWTNEKMKARNLYIFMGHGPWLFENENYKKLFRNAIFWAEGAGEKK